MLVTDFDGTLAEIVSDPVEALILPGSLQALERLVDRLRRVAILSSRPTSDLEGLVPLAGGDLIGDSGIGHLPLEARQRLDSFNAQAAKLLRTFNGVWLEMKPGATAVHYRHSNASFDELMAVLRPVLGATDLLAQPGRRGRRSSDSSRSGSLPASSASATTRTTGPCSSWSAALCGRT